MLLQSPPPSPPAAPQTPAQAAPAPAAPGAPGQALPSGEPAAPAAAPAPVERVFASEAGILFNSIKADGVKPFETVLGRLKQALAASADPVRQQQAAGWKIFKAAEPGPAASVLYVFVMDPAVKGADYGVAKILAEAYPAEAQELYRVYIAAFAAGQSLLSLNPVVPAPVAPGPEGPGLR